METMKYEINNNQFRDIVIQGAKSLRQGQIDPEIMFHVTNGLSIIKDDKVLDRGVLEHPHHFMIYVEAYKWAQVLLEKEMHIIIVSKNDRFINAH